MSDPITSVVRDLNRRYFLPGIQRTFEWDEEDVEKLFDSIMQDLPIGQITVWKLDKHKHPTMMDDQFYYRFIQNHINNEVHPFNNNDVFSRLDKENLDKYLDVFKSNNNDTLTAHHTNKKITTESDIHPENKDFDEINLVIDGQQRLTALYIGLRGNIISHKKGKHYDKEKNWDVRQLFINLASSPIHSSDDEFEFKFKNSFCQNKDCSHPDERNDCHLSISEDEYWFRVNELLPSRSRDNYIDEKSPTPLGEYNDIQTYIRHEIKPQFREMFSREGEDPNDVDVSSRLDEDSLPEITTLESEEKDAKDSWEILEYLFQKNLRRLRSQFDEPSGGYDLDIYESGIEDENKTRDIVKTSFFRLNDLGSDVSKEDKFLATTFLDWAYSDEEVINPRDQIYSYIKDFNTKYSYDTSSTEANENSPKFEIDLKFILRSLKAVSKEDVTLNHNVPKSVLSDMKLHWIESQDDDSKTVITENEIDRDKSRSFENDIRSSIDDVFKTLEDFGITERTGLNSYETLIPIIYYSHHFERDLHMSKQKIKRYLLAAMLSNLTSRGGGTWVEPALDKLNEISESNSEATFPYEEIVESVNQEESKHRLEPVKEKIITVLDSLKYSKSNNSLEKFVLNSIRRDKISTSQRTELDHIFPQSLIDDESNIEDLLIKEVLSNIEEERKDEIEADMGRELDSVSYEELKELSEELSEEFNFEEVIEDVGDKHKRLKDSLWNLELLTETVHSERSKFYDDNSKAEVGSVQKWLNREEENLYKYDVNSYKINNFIPQESRLYDIDTFDEFVEKRREMIIEAVLDKFDFELEEGDLESDYEFTI